jgi:hypothetical protein
MENIIKNKWHLHFAVGFLAMAFLLWLFSLNTSLNYLESFLISNFLLFVACVLWEFRQNSIIDKGKQQSFLTQKGDVFAGLFGGFFCFIIKIFI